LWQSLTAWLASGGAAGVVGSLTWLAYRLHADAVNAERRRADDWRTAWQAEVTRGDVSREQLHTILVRLREAP